MEPFKFIIILSIIGFVIGVIGVILQQRFKSFKYKLDEVEFEKNKMREYFEARLEALEKVRIEKKAQKDLRC